MTVNICVLYDIAGFGTGFCDVPGAGRRPGVYHATRSLKYGGIIKGIRCCCIPVFISSLFSRKNIFLSRDIIIKIIIDFIPTGSHFRHDRHISPVIIRSLNDHILFQDSSYGINQFSHKFGCQDDGGEEFLRLFRKDRALEYYCVATTSFVDI